MNRIYLLLVLLVVCLGSCQSTKTTIRQYCKVCLSLDDGIIIDDVDSHFLSGMENNEIWDIIKSVFEKEGFTNVYDKYELDYEFFNNNIKGIDSPEDREQLGLKLGIKYILKPIVLQTRESDGFVYDVIDPHASKYPFPRELHPNPRKPGENISILRYELIETSSGEVVYIVDFKNSDTELSFSKDDDEDHYNFSTAVKTLSAGSRKGTKFTIADCSCPKKKYFKRRKIWEKLGF
ncbi:hypothetical protein ACFSKL_08715 [Belliella marina]|uniref:Lipoprotein n=1 Tax=Belliella marina TaxID=1644146 RepID=A0ABW4VJJ2_9BACT